MNKETVYDLATDIVNIPAVMSLEQRIRLRALLFKLSALAIKAQKQDPTTLQSIENWAQVST